MKDEAITKINDEMWKDPANTFVEAIGHYLIDKCGRSEQAAAAIMNPDKTLKGCCDTIVDKAWKKAKGNVAAIQDDTVFGWADEYFGIASDGTGAAAPTQAAPSGGLAISFEDFM